MFDKLKSFFKTPAKDNNQNNMEETEHKKLTDSQNKLKSSKNKLSAHLKNLNNLKNTSIFSQNSAFAKESQEKGTDPNMAKQFKKYVNEKGYFYKTGVQGKSIFSDLVYGDLVLEFQNVDSYSIIHNYELIELKDCLKDFASFLHKQTPNLDLEK